jgi:hypothetical protein
MNVLERLQDWYVAQFDGQWDHDRGVTVEALDNPGWQVAVDLAGTDLEDAPFEEFVLERFGDDWVHARVVESTESAGRRRFEAFCGPGSLTEAVEIFLDWAEASEGR